MRHHYQQCVLFTYFSINQRYINKKNACKNWMGIVDVDLWSVKLVVFMFYYK